MLFSDIRVKDINAILHFTPQSMRFASKKRNDHIIGIQISGAARHFFADREFTLSENCLYFFNQNEDYRVEIEEKGVCFSIHFTTFSPINVKSFCVKIKDNASVIHLLSRIERQFLKFGDKNVKLFSDFYKLLGVYEDIHSATYHSQNEKILKAREYLVLHFKETDCITKAAEEYGVTRRRFNDIFKQSFHITPNKYIIIHKIDLAKRLLRVKELSIGDVADMCGFEDIYYFSKTFKRLTGQTAGEYRRKQIDDIVR